MKKIIYTLLFFLFLAMAIALEAPTYINDNISKADNSSTTPKEIGLIVGYKGVVKAYEADDFRGFTIKDNNTKLFEGYVVKTFTNAEAKIALIDNSKILLPEKSSITFFSNKVDVDNGTVYFKVTKRAEVKGFLVSTKTATIGVKGTKFAVMQDNESVNVFCKEGTISVTSIEGEFKRYVEEEIDEYSKYLKQQYEDYTSYKEKLRKEFIEYVKEIEMGAGKAITISEDKEVRDIEIPKDIDEMFKELDNF